MRHLYDQVSGPGTFLVTATRLGGRHGYDEAGAYAPLGGAVTGFAKAFARERPEALVKAVDFGPATSTPPTSPSILVEETLHDPGAVEVGQADLLRWTVTLEERPAADGGAGHGPRSRHRVRRDRSGGQHRFGHHRRPGRSLGR